MIRLRQGDMRQVLQDLPAACVDLIVADPPYGQTSLVWDKVVAGWTGYAKRVLKPTGSMWVFGTLRHFMKNAAEFSGWKLSHEVVWEKHNGTGLFRDRFRNVHETAAHFYKAESKWSDVFKNPLFSADATARVVRKKQRPAHWIGATGPTIYESQDGGPRLMRSVILARSMHGSALHPTEKPQDLLDLLIRYACPVGGVVLDPFAGSGSTGLAAHAYGCEALLVEANAIYAEIIRQRIAA